MQITELGLRPSLMENFPISFRDELKAINKAEREIDKSKYLKFRKKRLKAKLTKTKAENGNAS